VPTGGVELNNIGDFVKAGASALAVGGNLVSKKLMAAKDYKGLTENARSFANAVKAARA
jgi:2-dehydro-3-deoxyphosphogluconate aldolase/(4S)-4-hydroxy-2-oxoglutarate aldolase